MRLLRSEEEWDGVGQVIGLRTLEALAVAWYGDRLDLEWAPRTREESQRVLADVGLEGEFWSLPG